MYQRIEFMGLPGAGKTTCSSLFLSCLRAVYPPALDGKSAVRDGILRRDDGVIRNVAKKFPAKIWEPLCGMRNAMAELHHFAYTHAPLMAVVFQFLCDERMVPEYRECITYDFFKTAAEHQLICDQFDSKDVVIFEEGFGQVGCLLLGYLRSGQVPEPAIARYVQGLEGLQAVVWIDTDIEICLSRLEKRPQMPIGLVGEPRERCREVLKQSQCGFERFAEEMTKCGIAVYRVQNDDTADCDLTATFTRVASSVVARSVKETDIY